MKFETEFFRENSVTLTEQHREANPPYSSVWIYKPQLIPAQCVNHLLDQHSFTQKLAFYCTIP